MRILLGVVLIVAGLIPIVGRRYVGIPSSSFKPAPGTRAHRAWTSYSQGLGLLVGAILIVSGALYAFGVT